MKILFPIGSFYPTTFGGPGTILYWHGVYLKKNGIQPTFITTTEGINEEVVTDCFLNMPCGNVYYGKGGVLKLKTIRTMLSEVETSDIIHLTSLFSPVSIICFFYAYLFHNKTKIIWSVRGELNVNALKISSVKKKILLGLYKLTTKRVVFSSTSAKETKEIKAVFNNNVIEISNLMPCSNKLERLETNKRFLFLGRIHSIKNIDGLIKGFYNSKAFKNEKVFLDIAGEYDKRDIGYYNELQDLIQKNKMNDKVSFLGHVAGLEKEELLANAYFLILPSHTENFGNVVIEALNQGTPSITSKKTPWKELEKFECGFWIENIPEKIAETIDKATYLKEDDYIRYRENAKLLVDRQYAIEGRIKDWINEYNKLLLK